MKTSTAGSAEQRLSMWGLSGSVHHLQMSTSTLTSRLICAGVSFSEELSADGPLLADLLLRVAGATSPVSFSCFGSVGLSRVDLDDVLGAAGSSVSSLATLGSPVLS